jgi:hypothetical protein
VDRRFESTFFTEATDEPGLVLGPDGVVYIVKPDGTREAAGGGGGGAPGTVLPVADGVGGVTVDTTTYDDTITGSGKLTTLVFPAADTGQALLAVAIEGDAFPRILWASDPAYGLSLGDGTFDPVNSGVELIYSATSHGSANLNNSRAVLSVGDLDANAGAVTRISTGLVLNSVAANLSSGTGVPNIGGNVGDFFFRTDTPATPLQRIYVCTVAGTIGNATWVAIL